MELDFIYDEILISGRQQKMTDSCVLIEVLPVTFIESVKWIKLRFEVLPSPPMFDLPVCFFSLRSKKRVPEDS